MIQLGEQGKMKRVGLSKDTPAYVGNVKVMTHKVVSSYAIQRGRQQAGL